MMVKYVLITTLIPSPLGIKYQWFADGVPVTENEVPKSVRKKCCGGCGCDGESNGTALDSLLPFDNDEAATTIAIGKFYILASQNTYGLPEGIVKKKTA